MGIALTTAEAIDVDLMKERRFSKLYRKFDYANEVPLKPEGGKNSRPKRLPVKDRVSNFQEVLSGYTGEQALREASRCLRCDIKPGHEEHQKNK